MSAEQWEQVNEIVADALDQPSPVARTALVAQRCGNDAELLREVKSLLEQTTDSLESFAENATESFHRELSILAPGRRVGAYAIVRELGRGGMGAVYLAQRADGAFTKQVAIKVLKRGTDTDEVLRRFHGERDILARLNHPNIARLLDAGTTDDGLPYFIMDYVDGKPITRYADEHRLSVGERLNLFRMVCSAVSYAHQNLVVHRDLKPSNVLVTNEGEAKLLDFGIAKLVQETEAEQQHVTVTLLRVMTPEYASPEQVKGEPVTTVSDVYSLGVFLYELLTGERPYKLKRRTPEEITKAICEQEPERPSTAVAKGDGSSKLQAPSSKVLRGDLDNIVLKALRKEPERRYPSVDQFSDDIRRHLEGLPVRARKDTTAYRASKFIQRHKLAVAVAILFVLSLFAGTITIAWEAHEARREKELAQERFDQVRQLAHSVLFDYHDQIATLPGSTKIRKQLVADSLSYLDSLKRQATDTALEREIASAYLKIGDVQGRPYVANLGDAKGALESYGKSLALRQELSARQPVNAAIQGELAMSYGRVGEVNVSVGNPAAATVDLKKAIAIYDGLSRRNPEDKAVRAELGWVYLWMGIASGFSSAATLGDSKAAWTYDHEAQSLLEPLVAAEPGNTIYRRYLAWVYSFIADLLMRDGKQTDALDNFKKSLALFRVVAGENPTNASLQRELAVNYSNICNLMRHMDENAGALENGRQALAIFEKLAAADPEDANISEDLAVMHQNLAFSLNKENDPAGALDHFSTALRILKELAAKNPANTELLMREEWAYLKLSEVLCTNGALAEAIEDARAAISILESLDAANAKNSAETQHLAMAYSQLAKCHALVASKSDLGKTNRIERWREARNYYEKSLNTWQTLKSHGSLSSADAGKLEEIQRAIADCDAHLQG